MHFSARHSLFLLLPFLVNEGEGAGTWLPSASGMTHESVAGRSDDGANPHPPGLSLVRLCTNGLPYGLANLLAPSFSNSS